MEVVKSHNCDQSEDKKCHRHLLGTFTLSETKRITLFTPVPAVFCLFLLWSCFSLSVSFQLNSLSIFFSRVVSSFSPSSVCHQPQMTLYYFSATCISSSEHLFTRIEFFFLLRVFICVYGSVFAFLLWKKGKKFLLDIFYLQVTTCCTQQ